MGTFYKQRNHVLDRISPSPQVEMKFNPQSLNPVNGNDIVSEAFGGVATKALRKQKMFKAFFGFQDPRIQPP